jgi:SAM-dependent MidA family methyltransferase
MSANLPAPSPEALAHSAQLRELILQDITAQGGWIPFSRYMELALYAPGLGYYTAGARKFGAAGDFITAPELSTLFGRTVARQLVDVMQISSPHILELGAGSGKLAVDILGELEKLGALPESYSILEVSADLRQRQQALVQDKLPHLAARVHWLDALPENISGAVIGNEVLDALPAHLLHWRRLPSPASGTAEGSLRSNGVPTGVPHAGEGVGGEGAHEQNPLTLALSQGEREQQILERGVGRKDEGFVWKDRLPENEPLLDAASRITVPDDYLSEISMAARGLVASLCERLDKGVLLFIDYGFGAREYYHPQRTRGTLMCHYRHYVHDDPFYLPGLQDITAHVDFTAIAEAAIDHGAHLLGYTTQAHFLINNGLADLMREVSPEDVRAYQPLSVQMQKLTSPAEMGELFKVIALGKGLEEPLQSFVSGDRSRLL